MHKKQKRKQNCMKQRRHLQRKTMSETYIWSPFLGKMLPLWIRLIQWDWRVSKWVRYDWW